MFINRVVHFKKESDFARFCSNKTFRGTQYGEASAGAQHRAAVPILQGSRTRVPHQGGHRVHKRDNESLRSERDQ